MRENERVKIPNSPNTLRPGSTAAAGKTTPPHGDKSRALSAPLIGSANISRAELILQACDLIYSAYNADDFANPDLFVLQLGMKLECYDDDVIRELADPRHGIQTKRKKPPSLAVITEACEDILDRRPRPSVTMIEPPDDPVMQKRVGELLTGLAAKLHVDAQERRELKIRTRAEADAERLQAAIRAEWLRRCQEPRPYTPQLADIMQSKQDEGPPV